MKAPASRCFLPASLSTLRRALNPKGIPQQSPGLRGASYPGKTHATPETTLKGLWPTTTEIQPCRNPVGIDEATPNSHQIILNRVMRQFSVSFHPGFFKDARAVSADRAHAEGD